ncbi:helix-turn-helix domain-containing protein [Sphingomonas hengshuiensis]|uniref:hypothetical protein n=1 Tax=Sphingomonas hengshuiensis TaxID=1609977 RepID=UPI0012B74C56|nr:hypothetical protein [Sphingomonas hengshuiensis]
MNEPRSKTGSGPTEDEFAVLARECRTIADQLAELSRQKEPDSRLARGPRLSEVAQIRRYLASRRLRENLLPAELFADPAWDILLDLFACELEGTRVSVSSACIASCVPATTGLRWLSHLEKLGMISRESDAIDARRTYIRLTDAARDPIRTWLERVPWMALPGAGR